MNKTENREISFRVLCTADGVDKMLYFGMQEFDNGGVAAWPMPNDISHIDEYLSPLMQYTGLKDKNKNKIFEGDIVSHLRRLHEVCINFNGYYLQRYKLWRGKFKPAFQYSLSLFTLPDGSVDSAEIIGNIYENPELLKTVP